MVKFLCRYSIRLFFRRVRNLKLLIGICFILQSAFPEGIQSDHFCAPLIVIVGESCVFWIILHLKMHLLSLSLRP